MTTQKLIGWPLRYIWSTWLIWDCNCWTCLIGFWWRYGVTATWVLTFDPKSTFSDCWCFCSPKICSIKVSILRRVFTFGFNPSLHWPKRFKSFHSQRSWPDRVKMWCLLIETLLFVVYFSNHSQTAKQKFPTSVLTNGQSGLPNTFRWLCKWASRQFNSSGQFRDPSHVLAPGETCFSLSHSAMFTKLPVFVQFPRERFKVLLYCTALYCFTPASHV